jgi:release factor glutamine methyltransferase
MDMMTTNTNWNVLSILRAATQFLESKGIEQSRLNAERLLAHVLSLTRVELYLHYERPLNPEEREQFREQIKRRIRHEPLQYILGETEFMSLPFVVSPDVLIPRSETEILVETILQQVDREEPVHILDIGTGCGNIAVSLAKELPLSKITGIDRSEKALDIARRNASLNGVQERIYFIPLDILKDTLSADLNYPFDWVVSNPPYVSDHEWEELPPEIHDYEPREALCDDQDGLSFFRTITEQSKSCLCRGGKLVFEVGDHQASDVATILQRNGYGQIEFFCDLNSIQRIVQGTWNSSEE